MVLKKVIERALQAGCSREEDGCVGKLPRHVVTIWSSCHIDVGLVSVLLLFVIVRDGKVVVHQRKVKTTKESLCCWGR